MNQPPEPAGIRILKQLGRGGTAIVFQVFSEAYKKELALKCPLNDDPQPRVLFAKLAQREFHLVGRLKFPGLVKILEISAGQPEYVLMEFCRGPTLDQCGQIGNITLALNIISAIALNLEYLRAQAIIHGDLKPHNIFLPEHWHTLDGNKLFYVKLSDFSLGRFSFEFETDRIGVGTVGYMAPETIAESRSSFQSDIFSLGVIAYQMLTGHHPFMNDESDPVKINSRIREEDPTPIQTIRPDVSKELVELIDSLLAKNESDRPQSGWEVCQELDKLGAQYPYKRALRPAHFFVRDSKSSESVKSVLQMSDTQSQRLDLLTQRDTRLFRLILTANFLKGSLHYDGQHFVFAQEAYWPLTLRRRALRTYQQLPVSLKRLVVKAAIVGGREDAHKIGLIKDNELTNVSEGLIELIRQFVTPRVVKKYSAIYAAKAEQRSLYELAARLYVQAGNLEGAERCAYQAAHALNKEHRNDQALRLLDYVIEFAQMVGRLGDLRQLLMIKADTYKENGEADQALATYHQIIDLYRTLTPDKLLAETYKDLGDLYKIKQDFSAGIEALQKALKIYQDLCDELEISHTLNNIGNMHWIASNLDAALKYYRSALQIQRRLQATADVASTLSNIANIYVVKGRFRWSIRLMNLSLRIKKEVGNAGEIARTLNNLGYVYHSLRDTQKAVSCLTESLEINRRIGNKKEILFNLENLTGIRIATGQLRDSLQSLKEGVALSEELGDKRHLAAFNLNFGIVLKRMGRFSEAEGHFLIAENIITEINDRMLKVELAIQRAGLKHIMGNNLLALDYAKRALQEAEGIHDKSGQLNALMLITKISDDAGLETKAVSLAEELHLSREKTLFNFNKIERFLRRGENDEAFGIAVEALPRLETITEDIELAWMYNVAAELVITRGEYDSALIFLTRAQRAATTGGLMPEMITTLTLRGRIDFLKGDFENCYKSYKSALQICKKIADSITNETDRKPFENRRSVVFLVNEIKRLGTLMGQKRGRVLSTADPAPLQS